MMSETTTTKQDANEYYAWDGNDGTEIASFETVSDVIYWHRVVKIAIFDGSPGMGTSASSGIEFDGDKFDISFSFTKDSNGDSTGTGTVTLLNLNDDTQWSIKMYMGITITAGYEGSGNNGVIFVGYITNITDEYDKDGSVSLKLTIQMSELELSKTIVRLGYNSNAASGELTPYPEGTPFSQIVTDACNQAGIPLNRNDLEGDDRFVLPREDVFVDTVKNVISDIVQRANAILVKEGEITGTSVNYGNGFVYCIDNNYVQIIDKNKEDTEVAVEFTAANGLISVDREDILGENFGTDDDATIIEVTAMLNYKIRLLTCVSIVSTRQPHLNGVYRVSSYTYDGSSRSGSHTVKMSLFQVNGYTNSVNELQNMYFVPSANPPTEE